MSSFAERIKKVRVFFGLTQLEFGQKVRKSENTIYNWEAGNSKPRRNDLNYIVEVFGISLPWFQNGEGNMFLEDPPVIKSGMPDKVAISAIKTVNGDGYLKIWGITGTGNYKKRKYDPKQLDPIEIIKIEGLFQYTSKDCFRVKGEAMYDKLRDRALIGVDFNNKRIVTGKMYVLNLPHEGLIVKELHVEAKGIKVHAYNPRINDYYLDHEEGLEEKLIVGRVVWWLNEDKDED